MRNANALRTYDISPVTCMSEPGREGTTCAALSVPRASGRRDIQHYLTTRQRCRATTALLTRPETFYFLSFCLLWYQMFLQSTQPWTLMDPVHFFIDYIYIDPVREVPTRHQYFILHTSRHTNKVPSTSSHLTLWRFYDVFQIPPDRTPQNLRRFLVSRFSLERARPGSFFPVPAYVLATASSGHNVQTPDCPQSPRPLATRKSTFASLLFSTSSSVLSSPVLLCHMHFCSFLFSLSFLSFPSGLFRRPWLFPLFWFWSLCTSYLPSGTSWT